MRSPHTGDEKAIGLSPCKWNVSSRAFKLPWLARQMPSVRELDRLMLLRTAMHRILNFGIGLFLICGQPLRAANPDDIEFRARLVKDTRLYHMGESVPMEISYSSPVEKKYYRSSSGPPAYSDAITPQITPADGVLDLRELRRDLRGGWGSSGVGGFGYVGPQPVTQQLDLCEWYRFLEPGHYSVIFTSTEVSRVKSKEEGGGREPVTLESNPVDLDILPADPAWVAGELSKARFVPNPA